MSVKWVIVLAVAIIGLIAEVIWRRKNRFSTKKALETGKLLFNNFKEFKGYITLYSTDIEQFKLLYEDSFAEIGLNVEKAQLLDLLLDFGIERNEILSLDWRGEENEGETQEFIEQQIGTTITWNVTSKLPESVEISQKLKAINQDLKAKGYRLIVFNTDSDAFEISAISNENFATLLALNNSLVDKNFR